MRKTFEASAETARILDFFRGLPVGSPVSFPDLNKAVGNHTPGNYYSAIRKARNEGIVIQAIRGFGFERINAGQIVERQHGNLRSIRRKAGIISTEVSAAMRGNLDRRQQTTAQTIAAAAGVIKATAVFPRTNEPKTPEPDAMKPPQAKPPRRP